jgi:catechol 2,3-dioxygenase-like lactoylglutathione lyase family enzyme
MKSDIFAVGRVALKVGVQKIKLHKSGHEFEPHAGAPMSGSAGLCFITDVSLLDTMQHIVDAGVNIIEGPVDRHGAIGIIESFYFRGPDNNLIQVACQL